MNGDDFENNDVPALASGDLVQRAENAERNVSALKRIRTASLSYTSVHDWVDQNGRPYLQATGSEKIARLAGISWEIDEPTIEYEPDGHFTYTYKGTFRMGNASIEAIGTRSSKDAFFSKAHGGNVPPTEIDKSDVKKSAYTNLLGNGITRMLGLRGLMWEDIEKALGVDRSKFGKVEYAKKEMNEDAKSQRDSIGKMLMEMAGGDKTFASELLVEHTSFTGKDGKTVKGRGSLADITEKAMPIVYGKVKTAYDKWLGSAKDVAEVGEQDELV